MLKLKSRTLITLSLAGLLAVSCGDKKPSIEQLEDELSQANKNVDEIPKIDEEKVNQILQSKTSIL